MRTTLLQITTKMQLNNDMHLVIISLGVDHGHLGMHTHKHTHTHMDTHTRQNTKGSYPYKSCKHTSQHLQILTCKTTKANQTEQQIIYILDHIMH